MAHVCSSKSIRKQNSNFAANVENRRFGGESLCRFGGKIKFNTNLLKLKKKIGFQRIQLEKYQKQKNRFSDANKFKIIRQLQIFHMRAFAATSEVCSIDVSSNMHKQV